MLRIRESTDIEECRKLWKELWPRLCVFDLWEVRDCFERAYDRPLRFLVAELDGRAAGILPLSLIEEEGCFAFFPGETWKGKTWLEQNKIPSQNPCIRNELLMGAPGPVHLRYLDPGCVTDVGINFEVDETGYVFRPDEHAFSFERFMGTFSRKFRKNFQRELSSLEAMGVTYRHNHLPDVERLFLMNMDVFGESSYFSEQRFLDSFENLVSWLWDSGMLRITTVLIGGSIAAVDIGAVWSRRYTVLAGGTDPEFKGVAKIINLHHIEWSCTERMDTVDFLCGDFGWKERFHLTPRPLYKISSVPAREYVHVDLYAEVAPDIEP